MKQATQHWETFAPEFHRDGALRDLYVFDTHLQDWVAAATFISREYPYEFAGAWQGSSFPSDIAQLVASPEKEITHLTVHVSGVRMMCHFFTLEEMEFDLDPSEVSDASKLDGVFTFMKGLANTLGKDVVLTPENMPEFAIFRCRPEDDQIEHVPFGDA